MHFPDLPDDPLQSQAAQWAARLDRGLKPAEQDAYLQWLRDNPAHGHAMAELGKVWARLDSLAHWRPPHSHQPNPDLLASRTRRRFGSATTWAAAVGLAACLALLAVFFFARSPAPAGTATIVATAVEHLTLPDGSQVELNRGAKIEVNYSERERLVHVLQGQAHFTVAKNPARPFVVATQALRVRATGTAFSTSVREDAIAVLVTEGRVRLESPDLTGSSRAPVTRRELPELGAGEEVVVRTGADAHIVDFNVRALAAPELQQAQTWRTPRHLDDLPLRDLIAELNRFNARELVLADEETGDILVGGNFRTDDAETFVRLLRAGFEIESEMHGEKILLRRRR